MSTRTLLQDLDPPFGNSKFSLDTVTLIATTGDTILQGFNIFIITAKASFSAIIDRLNLESHVSYLPVNHGNVLGLRIDGPGMVGLNILDLQSIWPTPIKQETSRMTDLSLGLKDLLKNVSNHIGCHTKTLLDE